MTSRGLSVDSEGDSAQTDVGKMLILFKANTSEMLSSICLSAVGSPGGRSGELITSVYASRCNNLKYRLPL